MAFNKKTHLRQNIDALKTAFTLDRERRAPTPEEERTLGAYSGFGAIKEVLENPTGKPDKDGMATLVAELHEVIRANTPDEREYKRYMDGIKNSVLTAFYTPPKVADAIVEAIWDTRIAPQRILDPSAGTGVFVNAVDFHDPYAEITCFEKDPATGLILKHLHPEKRVRVQGFERIEPKYAGYYDVAVSNIPFGDVALFDPFFSTHTDPVRRQGTRALHNYFFMKSVDMVREGGLVAFITSQGVLNAEQGRPVREWLMNRCEPVSAIRLPNNLFTEHAGTEVGSDLVILQKKAATGELSERQRDFIESRKLSNGIRINNLFQSFDRVIHTEAKVGKDPYGKPAMEFTHAEGVDGIDREMRRMLSEDFNRHFNESYCLEHAPEQTPGTPERELSRPRQAERQRAERHEPRLAGEIVKEIIADARNLQQQREEGKTPRRRRNGGAGLPCQYRNRGDYPNRKQTRTSVTGFCRHSRRRTDRGGSGRLRGLVERAGESLVGAAPAETRRFRHDGYTRAARGRNNGTETAGGLRRVAFRHGGNGGSRTCHPSCRTGKRAAGTVADALRSVRLQRRGAAAGRTRYIQEKEQPPGSKAEDAPTTLIIRPGLLSGGTEERNAENDATGA